jgi:hypothetical protein
MAGASLSFGDYLKAAFFRPLKLPLLGAMPANLMALGVLGLLGLAVSPGFWLLGAAGEITYLFTLAGSARFQKLVQGEQALRDQTEWSLKVGRAVDRLSTEGRERYRAVVAQCRRVLGVSETLDADSLVGVRDLRGQGLNQLLSIFLRLLTSKDIIVQNVRSLDGGRLRQELEALEKRLAEAEPESALHRSLEGTADIQRRRLENLDKAGQSLQVIEAELDRIEQQVELIREESAVSGKPEALSLRLDAVTSTMADTTRWMDDHADFFDSLAGSETRSRLPDLPEPPRALEGE